MEKQCKILFISAPVGSGHVRAAEAVGAAIQRQAPEVQTEFVTVFDFFPRWIGKAILTLYLNSLALCPRAYSLAYSWGNSSSLALVGREFISKLLADRLGQYIAKSQPCAIVCTHATPAGLVAYLIKNKQLKLPTFAVLTDYVVHRLWVYPEIGNYIVASPSMRQFLVDHGISQERIHSLGIPVDRQFTVTKDRVAIKKKLVCQLSEKLS